ncbi:MAG TPA: VanZ family protein [Gemmatimonadaceae bacterium]|nr:VanZ family protein [Gemmatimonadaceae bacterium]
MTPRQRFLAARFGYVAVVLLATLANLEFSPDLAAASEHLTRAITPSLSWRDAVDGLRNAVLFAGLGSVWIVTSMSATMAREVRLATVTSFALSVIVEGLQVFSPVRDASILDVSTNTLGGLGGAVLTVMLLAAIQRARRGKSYVGVPTILIALPYASALLCEALAPLFHSDQLEHLEGGPFARLMFALQLSLPFDWTEIPFLDVPLYAAGGFLLVSLVRERFGADTRKWMIVTGASAVAVLVVHLLHGAFGLPIRWEAAITDAASIALGAWAAQHWLASLTQTFRGAARARTVIFSYLALLILWGWRPLLPETRWHVIAAEVNIHAFVPLGSLASRVDVFSALHVGQQFFLYLPLGALLAVWPLRLSGRLSHLWPAIWIAVVIELGHIVIVDRTFDMTNVLLAVAGLAMGWISVRRCGYKTYGAALSPKASRRA